MSPSLPRPLARRGVVVLALLTALAAALVGAGSAAAHVSVSSTDAAAGANTLHLYLLDERGQLTQPVDIRVTLTEEAQEIGPIDVALEPAGPGHYVGDGMAIPGAGTWTLAVTVRLDEFTAGTATTTFPVR